LISKAVEVRLLEGWKVASNGPTVPILQFSDDTLLFLSPNTKKMQNLRCLLLMFEAASGLKINLNKSTIIGMGDCPNLDEMAEIMGCQVGKLPSPYLGLPLRANHKSMDIWSTVIERIERLDAWKGMYLSKGGKLTMLKSVLANLPIYFLSMFSPPQKVIARIEHIQRNFLWDTYEGDKRLHLVGWNHICKLETQGGLGVRSIKHVSKALMMKWLWRFSQEKNSLWQRVIVAKYGVQEKG